MGGSAAGSGLAVSCWKDGVKKNMGLLWTVQNRDSQPVSASTRWLAAWTVVVLKREGSPGFALWCVTGKEVSDDGNGNGMSGLRNELGWWVRFCNSLTSKSRNAMLKSKLTKIGTSTGAITAGMLAYEDPCLGLTAASGLAR
jgi:hypothetical protein